MLDDRPGPEIPGRNRAECRSNFKPEIQLIQPAGKAGLIADTGADGLVGKKGREDAAAGHAAEQTHGFQDTEFVQAPEGAKMENGGPKTTTGKA